MSNNNDLICPTRDAVVTYLNAQIVALSLTPVITAIAAYESVSDLEGLTGGRILVIPADLGIELETFDDQKERKPKIEIVVQVKVNTTTTAELDPYLKLSEAFAGILLGQKLNGTLCRDVEGGAEGAYDRDILQSFNVLSCRMIYTFLADF